MKYDNILFDHFTCELFHFTKLAHDYFDLPTPV